MDDLFDIWAFLQFVQDGDSARAVVFVVWLPIVVFCKYPVTLLSWLIFHYVFCAIARVGVHHHVQLPHQV